MQSVPRSVRHPIIMLNPQNCSVKNNDGKFVFVGRVYGTTSVNEDPVKVQALLQKFPRLSAEELKTAKPGIYTWLLYSDDSSDEIRFISTEVVSPYEIGTRHQSLAHNVRVNASKVYGGGELEKKGDTIVFNLLSGTYSKPLIQYNYSKNVTNMIIAKFKTFFPDAEYDNSMNSYISKVHSVSNSLLTLYKQNGFTVRLFDSRNDCAEFSNQFWNIDFTIEYNKKEMEKADLENRPLFTKLYMESLERMIKLLEVPLENKAGGRRRRRHRNTLRLNARN